MTELDKLVATAFYGRFPKLREAQEAAIKPLLAGRNAVLTSATGSGKTEAVMAPLISRYWKSALRNECLSILYIAPTKALVNDLEKRLDPVLTTLHLRTGVRHGDRDDTKRKTLPHVLITTPESLDVMLIRKETALQSLRAVVIDEVHLLYNTQRGLQLSVLLQRLQKVLPNPIQWAALSATVGSLDYVSQFFMGDGHVTELLQFPAMRRIDARILFLEKSDQFLGLVRRMTDDRPAKLLVFANSRIACEALAGVLQNDPALQASVLTHYSSLAKAVRLETEKKFSDLRTAVCIATSTLELGIDIGDIDAVLLWDVPSGVDSFLQRIGRGNRRSNKNNVVCLVSAENGAVLINALRFTALLDAASKGELPVRKPYELFGAVGQQVLSVIAANDGRFVRVADICELLHHKPYLTRDIVESVLAELAENGFIRRHGYKNQYCADDQLYHLIDMKLIYGNYGIGSQKIDLFHGTERYGAKLLGEVPVFNLIYARKSTHVRFAGKCWRLKQVSREGIYMEPSRFTSQATNFKYDGLGPPSDPFITDRIWHLIHSEDIPAGLFSKNLLNTLISFINKIRHACNVDQIPCVHTPEGIRYFTFAGYIVNKAIGLYTHNEAFEADNYSLHVPSLINWTSIPGHPSEYEDFFHLLFEISTDQSIFQKQLPLKLQEREFLQNWLKDKTIPKILRRLSRATVVQLRDFQELGNILNTHQ